MTSSTTPGLRSEAIRQSNLSTVLNHIHLTGPVSRSALVDHTGLTRSAVAVLVRELEDLGYVSEQAATPDGNRGRPSPVAHPRPDENVVIAMEILVDTLAVAAVGFAGEIVRLERIERSRDQMPVEQTVRDLTALFNIVTGDLSPATALYGVGVAVAGLVRGSDQQVVVGPNIGWREVPLGELIRSALGDTLRVNVGNEAGFAAFGESKRGIAVGMSDFMFLFGEVGIGGGVISGGSLLSGAEGFAGEVGHILVNPDGAPCKCGNVGCWETEIGEGALLRRAGRPAEGGRAEIRDLIAEADRGEPVSLHAFTELAQWLAVGLTAITNVLDPEAIVLGGFLAESYQHIIEPLEEGMSARSLRSRGEKIKLIPSHLEYQAPLIGAAEQAWEYIIADPHGAALRSVRSAAFQQ